MSPEGLELLVPMGLELVEPPLQGHNRLGPESKDTQPGVFGAAFVGDDPGRKEYA
jgi:hypothetical protein